MAKRQKKVSEEVIDEGGVDAGANLASLKPNSKMAMMAQAVQMLAGMKKEDLSHFLNDTLAQIGHEADGIPSGAAEKNKASVAAKTVTKEEIAEIFGDETLSEEFKEKAATLFEAAVDLKVQTRLIEVEEHFETQLEEQVTAITEELTDKIDQYLTYVAEEWLEKNEVAITSAFRAEIAENLMTGLHELFTQNFIAVPENKIDVVDELSNKVDELEQQLNNSITENIELKDHLSTVAMNTAFEEVSEGLADTQIDRFQTLAESIEFDGDTEAYKNKLNVIKKKFFAEGVKTPIGRNVLNEEEFGVEPEGEKKTYTSPEVKRYAEAISRTIKK